MKMIHGLVYSDIINVIGKDKLTADVVNQLDDLFDMKSVRGSKNGKVVEVIPAYFLDLVTKIIHKSNPEAKVIDLRELIANNKYEYSITDADSKIK